MRPCFNTILNIYNNLFRNHLKCMARCPRLYCEWILISLLLSCMFAPADALKRRMIYHRAGCKTYSVCFSAEGLYTLWDKNPKLEINENKTSWTEFWEISLLRKWMSLGSKCLFWGHGYLKLVSLCPFFPFSNYGSRIRIQEIMAIKIWSYF